MNMKILALFCFSRNLSVCYGQGNTTYGNFKLADQEIIYQKIFLQILLAPPSWRSIINPFRIWQIFSNRVTKLRSTQRPDVDYKKFQFTQVGTPNIIQTGKYSGKASVGVKDGKYRITLSSLQLTGDIGYKKITAKESLTSFAAKNSGTILSQDWCKPNMLGLLDQSFTDKLQFIELKKKKKDNGDW
jgi:hypothetical protein